MKQNARVVFRLEEVFSGELWIRSEPVDKD
jgi:hypothetical protein